MGAPKLKLGSYPNKSVYPNENWVPEKKNVCTQMKTGYPNKKCVHPNENWVPE